MANWTEQLISLLGLDRETISSQMIPSFESFNDQASLQSHLEGLLGTSDPDARSFTTDFVRSRFPQPPSEPSRISEPPSNPSTSERTKPVSRAKGKKNLLTRAGLGKPLPPRQIESQEERMDHLSSAFGNMGTVYVKKKDQDIEFYSGMAKSKKGSGGGNSNSNNINTPQPASSPNETSEGKQPLTNEPIPHTQDPSHGRSDPVEVSSSLPSSKHPPPTAEKLAPTAEMLAIDAVIEELTSSPNEAQSHEIKKKLCFCQGRKHPPAPNVPLCLSCGLIICSAIYPSPLSLFSSCPSCSASPLLSVNARAELITKLASERDVLVEQQRIQVQILREQKRQNKEKRSEQGNMFPELAHTSSSALSSEAAFPSMTSTPLVGKHGGLAMANSIARDAQRTAKVLSLNMKTHKVAVQTKVKVKREEVQASQKESQPNVEENETSLTNDDTFIAIDGSELVRDLDDDGLIQPSLLTKNGHRTAEVRLRKGKTKEVKATKWLNRSIQTTTEEEQRLRYMNPQTRDSIKPVFVEEEEEEEEEKMEEAATASKTSGRGKQNGQVKKDLVQRLKKQIPGAAPDSAAKGKGKGKKGK